MSYVLIIAENPTIARKIAGSLARGKLELPNKS
jgi:hypothetical protein